MKQMRKIDKGITLIALVITIIILVILAGVALSQLTGNGIFEKVKRASEISNKSEGEEILKTKIYAYQMYAVDKKENITLEGLKEYLKDDEEIEYLNIEENGISAKVKLKKYKYEYVLNQQLEIIGGNNQETQPELDKINIDLDLEALLKEANMTITLEDILNTPAIMENVEGLIPILTESDVTRSETDGIVEYTTNKGEKIRTNSEYGEPYYAWKAFDGLDTMLNFAISKNYEATGYYLEYEFKDDIYAMQIKFKFANGSSAEGTRVIVIQGYNEEKSEWESLTNDITTTGRGTSTSSTFPVIEEKLNYSKAYKRYRLFVKEATYTSESAGADCSGLYIMQLYGGKASEISEKNDASLKKLLLSNSTSDKITLEQMVSNKEFTKRLVNSLSIDTVKNNRTLMENLPELIDVLTESNVTRSEADGIVEYTTNKGEKIRTNSEYIEPYYAWKAFDGNEGTGALSREYAAKDYYLEYEFSKNVYALKTKFKLQDGASAASSRTLKVQGYNENTDEWEDLTEEKTISDGGYGQPYPEVTLDLNCTNSYKRYRIYVTDVAGQTSYSGFTEVQYYGKVNN